MGDLVAEERRRRFEPWAWPLLRLQLLGLAPDDHILLVHGHHLIGDGYSAALLGQELLTVYHRLMADQPDGLPPLRTHFRDYVELLADRAAGPPDPDAHGWWRGRFGTPYRPPVLPAPGSAPDPGGTSEPVCGFTLDGTVVAGLRRLAASAATTLYAPVLTAYHRAVARFTGQDDLVFGLALTGRDHPLPDLHRIFGPCAAMLPLRLGGSADFAEQLAHVGAEVATARRYDDPPSIAAAVPTGPGGTPIGAQFFFSFLDFSARTAPPPVPSGADRLSLDWDADSELTPPPLGTDLFLTARPERDGLRVTLRGCPVTVTPAELRRLADWLRADLTAAARTDPARGDRTATPAVVTGDAATVPATTAIPGRSTRLAAAIVGYLPPPAQLAAIAGLPAGSLPRDQLRGLLFPGGRPRLLEQLTTPLGVSGFVCLPRFADELTAAGDALADETAERWTWPPASAPAACRWPG